MDVGPDEIHTPRYHLVRRRQIAGRVIAILLIFAASLLVPFLYYNTNYTIDNVFHLGGRTIVRVCKNETNHVILKIGDGKRTVRLDRYQTANLIRLVHLKESGDINEIKFHISQEEYIIGGIHLEKGQSINFRLLLSHIPIVIHGVEDGYVHCAYCDGCKS